MNPARRRTIEEMKMTMEIACRLARNTNNHDVEKILRYMQAARRWIPCKQEGDV